MSDDPHPEPKHPPESMEEVRLLLITAQNWVCDGCGLGWWEADAYQCPTCGSSEMHLWGDRASER